MFFLKLLFVSVLMICFQLTVCLTVFGTGLKLALTLYTPDTFFRQYMLYICRGKTAAVAEGKSQ